MANTRSEHRQSAEERRDAALEAAIHEFAVTGYHATKTADIAKRAGISQPYIYALFPDKKALFLAAQQRVRDYIRRAFTEAWEPAGSVEESLLRMGADYRKVLTNPDAPRCLLQGHAAAAADPEIRAAMRDGFIEMFQLVQRLSGADRVTVTRFMSTGMLLNVGVVLELPPEYLQLPDPRTAATH